MRSTRGAYIWWCIVGNVLIKKPATPGKENLKTVILQSHIDMVCEKNSDVEHDFLIDYYKLDSVGWGTPFLLVPEVTTVDKATRDQLQKAKERDLYLSNVSPLGVPFNNLRNASKEVEKFQKIAENKPITGIKPNNKIGIVNINSLSKFLRLILIPLNNNPLEVDVLFCETTPLKSSSIILEIGPIKGAESAIIMCLKLIKPIITINKPPKILLIV